MSRMLLAIIALTLENIQVSVWYFYSFEELREAHLKQNVMCYELKSIPPYYGEEPKG